MATLKDLKEYVECIISHAGADWESAHVAFSVFQFEDFASKIDAVEGGNLLTESDINEAIDQYHNVIIFQDHHDNDPIYALSEVVEAKKGNYDS